MLFKEWVQKYKGQDNPYGDLVYDINRSGDFPDTNDPEIIENYFYSKGVGYMIDTSAARETFKRAYRNFKRSKSYPKEER